MSLIASDSDGVHTDLNVFGLEAMNIALNAGGTGIDAFLGTLWCLRLLAASVSVAQCAWLGCYCRLHSFSEVLNTRAQLC